MKNNKLILILLNKAIQNAKKSEFYKFKLNGVSKNLKNITELKNIPFTTKEDLRNCYPFGALSGSIKDVIELHTSSGTTGKPTLSYFTKKDLKSGSEAIAKAWECFGIDNKSCVQFMMSYGLFSGATLNTYAIQELGGFVIPAGIQHTKNQIQMMIDFKVDTIVSTLGYYTYILEYLEENNISIEQLFLKKGIAAGEIYSNESRNKIEKRFNIKIFDHYGLCEINTGIAYECEFRTGLHILDEYVIPEIIDPETCQILPNDKDGELVLTTLRKDASPVIRYRTGDITSIKSGKCPCGRSSIRIDRIKRRVDDLIFIKGIKINPHELKKYILKIAQDKIYSDIKIRVGKDALSKFRPEILVYLKDVSNIDILNLIQRELKNKTLLIFDVKEAGHDYFYRRIDNKIKLVEYVDEK